MKYDQFGVMVADLKETLTKIKKDAEELGEDVKKEVGEKIDGYLKQLTEGTDDKKGTDSKSADSKTSDATSQKAGSDDASTLKGNLNKLKENVNKITESAKKDFNSIIDKVRNSQLKEDIDNLAGNVTAENGSVAVDSTAKGGVVAITGMGGEFVTSSEAAKKGAGIFVMVSTFRNNALVAVGKSEIKGNDISLKTTDDSKHVNIIYGNGKSFGAALNILSNNKNVAFNISDNGYLNSKFADNILAFDNKIKSLESSDTISDKTEIKILRINKRVQEILGENLFENLDTQAQLMPTAL